jgi:DGQHR domain-containing protein
MPRSAWLHVQALRVVQDPTCPLYLLSLTGEQLLAIADIRRIGRGNTGNLVGYQRTTHAAHVRNITNYLDSGEVLFPNSIVLALSPMARFRPHRRTAPNRRRKQANSGILDIPLPKEGDQKPAWIVDGQQRAMAIARSRRRSFLVPVNAFVAADEERQREHFLRVNSTKPLPRGLITELIPEISSVLPEALEARRIPAALCDLLNRDPESPFFGLIRRSSTQPSQRRASVVADTVIVKILHASLSSPSGCLFPYRNIATGVADVYGIRKVLLIYWNGVHEVFRDAWGKSPNRSRLMHSAGLLAMGRLMDRVMNSIDPDSATARATVRRELARLRPVCHWTSGHWKELGGLAWNDLQNVPSHVRMLSNHLVTSYLRVEESTA